MRTARRLLLVATVSSILALQAGGASAEKPAAKQNKVVALAKRARAAFKSRFGVRSEIRRLKFGVGLKLQQGDLVSPTVMLKDPSIIGLSGSFNFRERRAVSGAQKKVNKAWRRANPGVPAIFNQPGMIQEAPEAPAQPSAPETDDRPMPGQYL